MGYGLYAHVTIISTHHSACKSPRGWTSSVCYNENMNVSRAGALVEGFLVTPTWVARHYGVSRITVYRAISAGRLKAIKVIGAPRQGTDGARSNNTYAIDVRDLPPHFPR